jgi:hypothetical protein
MVGLESIRMNAVKIEEAISRAAPQAFDLAEVPSRFLAAFDAKNAALSHRFP